MGTTLAAQVRSATTQPRGFAWVHAGRMAAAIVLVAGMAAAGVAQAQSFSLTTSNTETLVFNPEAVTTVHVTNYSTQILGRLKGGTPLYDQTFGVPFADPIVQGGVVAARAAITMAGGPGVIIGAPVLTDSS